MKKQNGNQEIQRIGDAGTVGRKKNKSDELDANEMTSRRYIWGGLTRRALL